MRCVASDVVLRCVLCRSVVLLLSFGYVCFNKLCFLSMELWRAFQLIIMITFAKSRQSRWCFLALYVAVGVSIWKQTYKQTKSSVYSIDLCIHVRIYTHVYSKHSLQAGSCRSVICRRCICLWKLSPRKSSDKHFIKCLNFNWIMPNKLH